MRIWRSRNTSPAALASLASRASEVVDCLVSQDGGSVMVLCGGGSPPPDVEDLASQRRYSAGNFDPRAGPWVFAVGIWTPVRWGQEICDWYRDEHMPMLLECDAWKGVDLREVPDETGRRFLVLHRLAHREALESPQRAASRRTAWFQRLARNDWFDGPFERMLYRRAEPA